MTGPFGVGAVGEQELYALFSPFRERLEGEPLSTQLIRIVLEVARVDDRTDWSLDGKAQRLDNGMCDWDGIEDKRAYLEQFSRLNVVKPHLVQVKYSESFWRSRP